MLLNTQNHCPTASAAAVTAAAAAAAANLAASKGATDFSIAAIMSRGASSGESSEKSMSKFG